MQTKDAERKRKAEYIRDLYKDRGYTQEEIAERLHMNLSEVRTVTQAYNFHHTIQSTGSEETGGNGKPADALVFYNEFYFLDKYNF